MPEPAEDDVFRITVGPASFEVRDGRVTDAINQSDFASGTVPAQDMARSPADWAAPAEVTDGTHVLMAGEVVEAHPQSDGAVFLSLRSGLMLDETLMPPWVSQNLTPEEIVYTAVSSAGFSTDRIDIYGVNALPTEPMWVLVPLGGVHVKGPLHVGVVEFIDVAAGHEILRRFSPPLEPVFTEPLKGAAAFARVAVVGRLLYAAEQEGLALIDTAIAWLTTRLRYSWSHGPDGSPQRYERAPTRVTVERRDGVGVLAVDGPRRWWGTARRSGAAWATST